MISSEQTLFASGRPLRVLHVLGGVSARSGGPTTALFALCGLFDKQQLETGVVVASQGNADRPIMQRLREACGQVWSFPKEIFHPFEFSTQFSRFLPSIVNHYDVLHVHSMWNWASYWALRTAWHAHKPAIIRPAGALDAFDLQKHRTFKRLLGPRLLRRYFEPPNVFHCTARREATNLVTYGGQAEREVLPLPVEVDIEVATITRMEARAELKIPAEAKVVLFLGRMNYKKGLDVLLPALASARQTMPELILLLVGDGESDIKASVIRMTGELGLVGAIRPIGFAAGRRRAEALAASDLFVLPSMNENFGVSVVEALQAGLPVLISREVYIADDIAGSEAVYVCERTPKAVADGLLLMLQTPRASESRAAEARSIWTQRYSPAALRSAYWDFYSRTSRHIFS